MYNFNKNLLNKLKEEEQNILLFDLETTGLIDPVEISQIGYIVINSKYNEQNNCFDLKIIAEKSEYFYTSKEIEPNAVLVTNIAREEDLKKSTYISRLEEAAKEKHIKVNIGDYHQLTTNDEIFTIDYLNDLIKEYNITIYSGHNLYEYDFFKVLCGTYGFSVESEIVFDTLYYLIHSKTYKITKGQNLNKLVKEIDKKMDNPELTKMLKLRDTYHDALIDVKVNKFLLEKQLNELAKEKHEEETINKELDTFKENDILYTRTEVSGDSILTVKQLLSKCEELNSKTLVIVNNTFTGNIKYSNIDSGDINIIYGIEVKNLDTNEMFDILLKNTIEYRKILPLLNEQKYVTNKSLEDIKKYTENLVIPSQKTPLYLNSDDSVIHWLHLKGKNNEAFTKQELNGFLENNIEDLSVENGKLKDKKIHKLLNETIKIENGWEKVDFKFYKSLGLSSFPPLPVLYKGENNEIETEPETLEEFLTILRNLVYSDFEKRNLIESINICYGLNGNKKQLEEKREEYFSRIEEELSVLKSLGNPDYVKYFFLVKKIGEFVKFGPGRGSGAGSILLWILGVTDTDPIKYGLLFERFMDPERADFPDVDLDIASKSYAFNVLSDYFNKEILKYIDYSKKPYDIYDSYILENYIKPKNVFVGKITTVSKSSGLTVSNNFVRLNSFPESMKSAISREFNDKLSILENFKMCSESKMFFEKYPIQTDNPSKFIKEKSKCYNDLLHKIDNIKDMTTNYGLHAGGVIFFPFHAHIIAPIHQENAICFDKDDTESMHMIKMDLLGLKTHAVVQELQNYISTTPNKDKLFNLNFQAFNDPKVFLGLSLKYTAETFQMGSEGMDKISESLSPLVFEDCIATTALYRPGPLGSGAVDDYICSAQMAKIEKYNLTNIVNVVSEKLEELNVFKDLRQKRKEVENNFKNSIRKYNELLILVNDYKKHNKDDKGKSLDLTDELADSLSDCNYDITRNFLDYQKICSLVNDLNVFQIDNSYRKMIDEDGETFYVSKMIQEVIQNALVKSRYRYSIPKDFKDEIRQLQSFYLVDDPIINENTIYDNEEHSDEDYEYFEMFLDTLQKHGISKERGIINKDFLKKGRSALEYFDEKNETDKVNVDYINKIKIDSINSNSMEKIIELIKAYAFLEAKNEMIRVMSVDFDPSLIINQVVENLLMPTLFFEDEKFLSPLISFFNAWNIISKTINQDLLNKLIDPEVFTTDLEEEIVKELQGEFEKQKSNFNKTYIEIINHHNISLVEDFIEVIKEYESKLKDNERYSTLTSETYGVMVYQEQIMKMSVQMAGYTKADSNQLRKAIAKQKRQQMIEHSNKFIRGISSKQISKITYSGSCSNYVCFRTIDSEIEVLDTNTDKRTHIVATIEPNGKLRALNACKPEHKPLIEELNKEENEGEIFYFDAELSFLEGKFLWAKIEAFGAYAFNKSHSASYSIVTYLTQYYKEHFPMETYTYFLRHVSEKNKMNLVREIHKRGIKFELQKLDKDISLDFTFNEDTIFVPLTFIKSLGEKEILSTMAYFSEYDINTIEDLIVLTGNNPKKKILEVLGTLGLFNFKSNNKEFCNISQRSWNNLHPLSLNKKSILIDYIYKEGIKSQEFKTLYKEEIKRVEDNEYLRVIFKPKYFELLHNLYYFQKRLSIEGDFQLDSKSLYLNEDLLALEKTLIQTLLEDLVKSKPTIEEGDVSFLLKNIPIFDWLIVDTIENNGKVEEGDIKKYKELFLNAVDNTKMERNYLFFKEEQKYIEMKEINNDICQKTSPILRRVNERLVDNIDIQGLSIDENILDNEDINKKLTNILEQKVKYNKLTLPFIDKLRLLFSQMQTIKKETIEDTHIYNTYKLYITPLVSKNGLFDKIYLTEEDILETKSNLEGLKELFEHIIETENKTFEKLAKIKTLLTALNKLYSFVEELTIYPKESVFSLLEDNEYISTLDKDEMSIVYDVFLKEGASIFTIKKESLNEFKHCSYYNSLNIIKKHLNNNYSKEFDFVLSCVSAVKSIRDQNELESMIENMLDEHTKDSFLHSFETNKEMFIQSTFNNKLFDYEGYPLLKNYIPQTLSTDIQSNIMRNNLAPRHGNSSSFNFLVLTEHLIDNKNLNNYISDLFFALPEEEKENFLPVYMSYSPLSKKEKEKLLNFLPPKLIKVFEDTCHKIVLDSLYEMVSYEGLNRILTGITSLKSNLRKLFLMKTYKFVEPKFGETAILPIIDSKKRVKKIEVSFVMWFPWAFLEDRYHESKQSFMDALYEKGKISIKKKLT